MDTNVDELEVELASQKRRHEVVLSAIQGLHERHREELKHSFWTGVAVGAPAGLIAWVLGWAFA